MSSLSDQGFLDLTPLRIEYRMAGPRPDQAPTLILLHEGLGSAAMWGDFPEKLAAATGFGVFTYSRIGYGQSSPAVLPRTLDFMHVEARDVLPRLLDAIGFRQGLLILDEATEGLAPLIRAEIWSCLTRLKTAGQSILVIDKNVAALTRIADRHYIIERGKVVWSGDSAALAAAPDVQHRYLGI